MKKILATIWLSILFACIAYIFWQSEWKYSLPTPIPANYKPVGKGTLINLPALSYFNTGKPVLLHFFNPDCPCSRFNINYFKSLEKKYNDRVFFAVVVMTNNKNYTVKDIQNKFGIDIPVLFDKALATACGVYATPQAAIIDRDHKLFYRGNYNKSRYCTNPDSNYAQMAIDSLLNHHYEIVLEKAAIKSYGCSLPDCKK